MALSLPNLFWRKNKTGAFHAWNVNSAAFWPDDPRTVSASRGIRASTQIVSQRVADLYLNYPNGNMLNLRVRN